MQGCEESVRKGGAYQDAVLGVVKVVCRMRGNTTPLGM
jgi:hypothetical protein